MSQAADPHANPPLPAGLSYLQQSQVTPPMTTWAVKILNDGAVPFFALKGPRLFGGKLPIVARVEWHPPDAPIGPNAWHRGVSLLADARTTNAEGIDVSHYQGPNVDWEKRADLGNPFSFVKATEGVGIADDTFATNWAKMKAAGILRGAYHFFRPGLDAAQQAAFFWSRLKNDPGELPPVIDVEAMDGITGIDVVEHLWTMVQALAKSCGRRPFIYTAAGFWNALPANVTRAQVCGATDLWVAHWTNAALPLVPNGWTAWRFWQYAGDVAAEGVPGFADLNRHNGSITDLLAYAGNQPPVVTPPAPVNIDLTTTRGLQMALTYLAKALHAPELDPLGVDGIYGPHTNAAVLAFQARSKATDVGALTRGALQAALDKARSA